MAADPSIGGERNTDPLRAGAAAVDITPSTSQFLHGYPHVERMSTGVHDPLFASALCLQRGAVTQVHIGTDTLSVPSAMAARARARIAEQAGIDQAGIAMTGTHTHSAPILSDQRIDKSDPTIPEPDAAYVQQVEDGIVTAAVEAVASLTDAQVALTRADATGIGTHRHDPDGPSLLEAPVIAARRADNHQLIAVMLVCAMHPTVMHEDSKLISADFPGEARTYLQQEAIGAPCPVIHHMGAAGNQSPRHVTKANTFEESRRIGRILGKAVERALQAAEYQSDLALWHAARRVELPTREVPDLAQAERELDEARQRFHDLKEKGAPRQTVRTAECDVFGSEVTRGMAKAAQTGRLAEMVEAFGVAEVIALGLGPWTFVGWPGEVFVEWALALMEHDPNAILFTPANGRVPGYLVTQEAIDGRWYEGMNALFQSPEAPRRLLNASLELLQTRAASV